MLCNVACIIGLLAIVASIRSIDGLSCGCMCCVGNRCTRTQQNNATISTCESCQSVCQSDFSSTCAKKSGRVSYQCMDNSLTSRIFGGPNWIGTFLVADGCETDECCCLTDTLYVNRGMNNRLHMQGQFVGQCPSGSPTLNETYAMPTTFSTELRLLATPMSVKLSADSRSISFLETDNKACRYSAVRQNSATAKTINWIGVALLSGLIGMRGHLLEI